MVGSQHSTLKLVGGAGFERRDLPGVLPGALPTELPAYPLPQVLFPHGTHFVTCAPAGRVTQRGNFRHTRPARAYFALLGVRFGSSLPPVM